MNAPGNRQNQSRQAGRGGQRIRLGDIAAELGLSTATVSLALRDSPLVAEETKRRVKEQAERSGYIYNRFAASLRTASSGIIGVAVHDSLNPYFARISQALEDAFEKEQRVVLVCNHRDDIERQRRFFAALMQHRVDGLVLCPSLGTRAEDIAGLTRAGVPVTLICREVEGVGVPIVRVDDFRAAHMATRHLIDQGHRRIAIAGGRVLSSAGRERRAGWAAALREAGLDPAGQVDIPDLMTHTDGREAVADLLSANPRPTAVVAFNDLVASGILEGVRLTGAGLAVTGFDDILPADGRSAALTSVDASAAEIGRIAASLILRQISGAPIDGERYLLEPQLKIRKSSLPPGA